MFAGYGDSQKEKEQGASTSDAPFLSRFVARCRSGAAPAIRPCLSLFVHECLFNGFEAHSGAFCCFVDKYTALHLDALTGRFLIE